MNIPGIGRLPDIAPVPSSPVSSGEVKSSEAGFSTFLNEAINKVNSLQEKSAETAQAFAAGLTDNIHQVMIDAEKASIALQFTLQVRNKILDAYSEIMRIQI